MTNVVIRFCGDSGDGMQLTGTLFSNLSAILGNEISSFPDFPAEIRAPQGTLGGVSALQVNLGSSKVYTPGDKADVLVAMNPAALKVNAKNLKEHGVLVFDTDSFNAQDLEKAAYLTDNPFTELAIPETVQLVPVALSTLTKASLADFGMDNKSVLRCKNMFALGVVCWLFNRPIDKAVHFLENKFGKKPDLLRANVKVITDGFNYASNLHLNINRFVVGQTTELPHGTYTSIAGNKATAYGLIAAAEKACKRLFLGSYPITPATDIMHELAARKDVGVMVVQAEDEISGACLAIGASFAGDLGVTSTSGPGLSLKSEAIGLAVMSELPLVIIDVQRGGPSTGMPTKTEQTDLSQALYGRNGECPLVVIAASTPANCFDYAYQAAKIALENMTPVILLSDTYLANGTSLWRLPKLADLPQIEPQNVPDDLRGQFNPALRDPQTCVRYAAAAGKEGFEHRNMGLERDAKLGTISTDPKNHALMVANRQRKVDQIADRIPQLKVSGTADADTIIVGWGSTEGHIKAAAAQLAEQGKHYAVAHFNYIRPLPVNTFEMLSKYRRVVVCELNSGQFAAYLRSYMYQKAVEQGCMLSLPLIDQYNKVEGQPFTIAEIVDFLQ